MADLGDAVEWRLADLRIELLEEGARSAIRDKRRMAVIRAKPTPPPPFLLPSRWGNVLFGPDGKKLEL